MVHIWSNILEGKDMRSINTVNSLPDVSDSSVYGSEILAFYRAGITRGNDDNGTFNPTSSITRAEAATMFLNLVDSSSRVSGRTYGSEGTGGSESGGQISNAGSSNLDTFVPETDWNIGDGSYENSYGEIGSKSGYEDQLLPDWQYSSDYKRMFDLGNSFRIDKPMNGVVAEDVDFTDYAGGTQDSAFGGKQSLTLKQSVENALEKSIFDSVRIYRKAGSDTIGVYWSVPKMPNGFVVDVTLSEIMQCKNGIVGHGGVTNLSNLSNGSSGSYTEGFYYREYDIKDDTPPDLFEKGNVMFRVEAKVWWGTSDIKDPSSMYSTVDESLVVACDDHIITKAEYGLSAINPSRDEFLGNVPINDLNTVHLLDYFDWN
jgi:hypothetical protein